LGSKLKGENIKKKTHLPTFFGKNVAVMQAGKGMRRIQKLWISLFLRIGDWAGWGWCSCETSEMVYHC
jgi:hypothetical protein